MLFVDGCHVASEDGGEAVSADMVLSPFGDGLFETMLLCEGRIHLLDLHLSRLQLGGKKLLFSIRTDTLVKDLSRFIEHYGLSEGCYKVRLSLQREAGTRGYDVKELPVRRLITASPIDFPAFTAIRLTSSAVKLSEQPLLAGIKHANRLEQILARADLNSNDFDEALMLDQKNQVVESIASNLFLLEAQRLFTPIIDKSGVKGVARSWLLERATSLGLECSEDRIDLNRVLNADGVMLSNAINGFRQVSIYRDNAREAHWPVNETCQLIQQRFIQSITNI